MELTLALLIECQSEHGRILHPRPRQIDVWRRSRFESTDVLAQAMEAYKRSRDSVLFGATKLCVSLQNERLMQDRAFSHSDLYNRSTIAHNSCTILQQTGRSAKLQYPVFQKICITWDPSPSWSSHALSSHQPTNPPSSIWASWNPQLRPPPKPLPPHFPPVLIFPQ